VSELVTSVGILVNYMVCVVVAVHSGDTGILGAGWYVMLYGLQSVRCSSIFSFHHNLYTLCIRVSPPYQTKWVYLHLIL